VIVGGNAEDLRENLEGLRTNDLGYPVWFQVVKAYTLVCGRRYYGSDSGVGAFKIFALFINNHHTFTAF